MPAPAEAPLTLEQYLQSSEKTKGFDPRMLFALRLFQEMSSIPSPSGHELPLCEFVQSLAHASELTTEMDNAGKLDSNGNIDLGAAHDAGGNVAIWVPATPGYEEAPGLILQVHMDGVPKALAGKPNPAEYGVRPIIVTGENGDELATDGTTLWADDRGGLCAALALALDKTAVHGKLLILATVQEETTMKGVKNFGLPKPDVKEYPGFLNLDGEHTGTIDVGSACAGYTDISLPIEREPQTDGMAMQLEIVGTEDKRHSGVNIHEGRLNANKILSFLLGQALDAGIDLRLVEMSDDNHKIVKGEKSITRNSICYEAQSTITVPPNQVDTFKQLIARLSEKIKAENQQNEPQLQITLDSSEKSMEGTMPLSAKSTKTFIQMINDLPHGVIKTVEGHSNRVLISTNLAVAKIDRDELAATVIMMSRAAEMDDMEKVRQAIAAQVSTIAQIQQKETMKGWRANNNFQMTELLKQIYKELFGKEMEETVSHGGLEAGGFEDILPGIDIKVIGTTISGPHGTKERMNLLGYDGFIRFVFAYVEAYAKRGMVA